MRRLRRRLDLQAKVILVLVGVIAPTFLVVTWVENRLMTPLLREEVRQMGITSGRTLGTQIISRRLYTLQNPTPTIEPILQEHLLSQPSIIRIDVIFKNEETGTVKLVASNFEEDPDLPDAAVEMTDSITTSLLANGDGDDMWDIRVPIYASERLIGTVRVVISLKILSAFGDKLWQVTLAAAFVSIVLLVSLLTYFLRRTISTDRKLKQAESANLELTQQLHEIERQLMNNEKLAVMGQLTASFAHEIGTPLNAVGGHLQLLKEEIAAGTGPRIEIIEGQLGRIEQIVKTFLQSTAKPSTQTQLVDPNQITLKILSFVKPRADSLRVEIKTNLKPDLAPIRMVPDEFEQILLNLVNNSLDSLAQKQRLKPRGRFVLEVATDFTRADNRDWASLSVYDTGVGIRRSDLAKVLKPFYSTKAPGEGTGLGLTICSQIARKYGGLLEIDSREGSWAKVSLKIPHNPTQGSTQHAEALARSG